MRILFPSQHRQYILQLERELQGTKNAIGVTWALYNAEADRCIEVLEVSRRTKVVLEDLATAHHDERAHEGKFWVCERFGCSAALAILRPRA